MSMDGLVESGCRDGRHIYPLEFHRRSELQWRHRVKASTRSGDDKASTIRGNECCPNCCLPAAKPFVSRYKWFCGRQAAVWTTFVATDRSEEHTSELQSHSDLVCRLLLEKKTTQLQN